MSFIATYNTWLKRIAGVALVMALALSGSAQSGEIVRYVLTDHLGSPVIKMDMSGRILQREVYGPYGQAQISPNNSGIGYTGHMQDGDTGLTYMQARYYDPEAIRFLSPDPVRFSPGQPNHFNLYWYAEGNPYMFTDPDGREAACISLGTTCGQGVPNPTRDAVASVAVDFVPVVGDVKGIVEAAIDPTAGNVTAAVVSLAPGVGDVAGSLIKGADNAISMEKAINAAVEHVGSNADVVITKSGNVQFTSTTTDAAGNIVTRNARFDVNPSSGHVQKQGPHLNLETQVNGKSDGTDPHIPIDPETIRQGDYD